MEVDDDQGMLGRRSASQDMWLMLYLQRVYFGNWLRDYSQVRCQLKTNFSDAKQRRLSILQPSAKFK
jgi:hypothetical protein